MSRASTRKRLLLKPDSRSKKRKVRDFNLHRCSNDNLEHAFELQKEDFRVRLEQEVKDAFERGRRQGFTEGLGAKAEGGKPAVLPPMDDAANAKVEQLQQQVSELEDQVAQTRGAAAGAVRRAQKQGLVFLHDTTRLLMNEVRI